MLERISVANVVGMINGKIIGMLNKKSFSKWHKVVGVLGWGALLYDQDTIRELGWTEFEGEDMRFQIDPENLTWIIELLNSSQPNLFEQTIDRELREELTEECFAEQTSPILSVEEFNQLEFRYYGMVTNRTITSNFPGMYSNQYMRLFAINWPDFVLSKIFSSPIIFLEPDINFSKKISNDIPIIDIFPKIQEFNKKYLQTLV